MFGLGMVVHFALSLLLEKIFFKKFELKKIAQLNSPVNSEEEGQTVEFDDSTTDNED